MILAGSRHRQDWSDVTIRIFGPGVPGGSNAAELSVDDGVGQERVAWTIDRAPLLALASDPDGYGRALGRSLFADPILGARYREAVAAIRATNRGLRVRLRLDPDAPELQDLRWERMYQPIGRTWEPIALAGVTPFSRWFPPTAWNRPLPINARPIRVLAVAASPRDLAAHGLDPIDAEELATLHRTFEGLPEIQATYLESGTSAPPTLDQLRASLQVGVHVVHVLCHGAATPGGSVLYLENVKGDVEAVSTERLVAAFSALREPPLLCFLGACESAARGRSDAFVPLGPALVQDGGLQATVAMSDRVGQGVASVFADQFYRRLLAHGMVDLATNEARALVKDTWDWGVPVLFSRLEDNQLIDFPVGQGSALYFEHSQTAVTAVSQAIQAAETAPSMATINANGQAFSMVDALRELIQELSKSHRVLVDFASAFRDVPTTRRAFRPRFNAFYLDFKRHYDAQDWVHEDTSCGRIQMLSAQLLPELSRILRPPEFQELQQELAILSDADNTLLTFLREFLDQMDGAVEQIRGLLDDGKVQAAIDTKREFEARISPSFRRSKEMLSRMSSSVGAVAAA